MPWSGNYRLKRTEIADKSTFDRALSVAGLARVYASCVYRKESASPALGCAFPVSACGSAAG